MFKRVTQKNNIYRSLKKRILKISKSDEKFSLFHINKLCICRCGNSSFFLKKITQFSLNKPVFFYTITKKPKAHPFKLIKA